MSDFYELLGVSPTAENIVIQAAYKAMMRQYHPDRNAQPEAEARAKAINEAYDVLRDPERRSRYDAQRKGHKTSAPLRPAQQPQPKAQPNPQASKAKQAPTPKAARSVIPKRTRPILKTVVACGVILFAAAVSGLLNPSKYANLKPQPLIGGIATPQVSRTPLLGDAPDRYRPYAAQTPQQFEWAMINGYRDAMSVLTSDPAFGTSLASQRSKECRIEADKSLDLSDVDYCVAFDLTSLMYNSRYHPNVDPDPYLVARSGSFANDYVYYQGFDTSRIDTIRQHINALLSVKSSG